MKNQEQSQKPENNPSMDEILHSIRGVINEDSTEGQKAETKKGASEDVLELTEIAPATPSEQAATSNKGNDSQPTTNTSSDTNDPTKQSTESKPITPDASVEQSPNPPQAQSNKTTQSTDSQVSKAQTEQNIQEKSTITTDTEVKKENSSSAQEVSTTTTPAPNAATNTSEASTTSNNTKPTAEATASPAPDLKEGQVDPRTNTNASSEQSVAPQPNQTQAPAEADSQNQSIENEPLEKNSKPESSKGLLVSDKVASETASAIKDLMNKASKPHSDGLKFRSGTTVEDLILEAIKPYLSKWLDDNLHSIVKHLVEKEIKKLMPDDD